MSKRWSPEEDALLIEKYAESSIDELTRMLGRSVSGIQMRAFILRLSKPKRVQNAKPVRKSIPRSFSWSEVHVMKEMGHTLGRVELAMLLPRLSVSQMRELAEICGVSLPW